MKPLSTDISNSTPGRLAGSTPRAREIRVLSDERTAGQTNCRSQKKKLYNCLSFGAAIGMGQWKRRRPSAASSPGTKPGG
jgi:hypothetical protein